MCMPCGYGCHAACLVLTGCARNSLKSLCAMSPAAGGHIKALPSCMVQLGGCMKCVLYAAMGNAALITGMHDVVQVVDLLSASSQSVSQCSCHECFVFLQGTLFTLHKNSGRRLQLIKLVQLLGLQPRHAATVTDWIRSSDRLQHTQFQCCCCRLYM